MPKIKCQHETKSNRKPRKTKRSIGDYYVFSPTIKCNEMSYEKYPGQFGKWLCKSHYREHQEHYTLGNYNGYRAYMFSDVTVIYKGKQKHETGRWHHTYQVFAEDKIFTFTNRKSALRSAIKRNRLLTNPVGLRVLQLRTV